MISGFDPVPRRIAVVGAINMDITGTPDTAMIDGDSNPGVITLSPGGVGRNLAENLILLGNRVSLVTALGEDFYATILEEHCRDLGLDLSMSFTVSGGRTSSYLCLNGTDGNVIGAVSDMAIVDQITPERLRPCLPRLNETDLVVMDANLPAEVLTFLSHEVRVPLLADPVSVKKAPRLSGALHGLLAIKPNVPEAEVLSGVTIRNDRDLAKAAEVLYASGVRNVFISLGARGVHVYDGTDHETISCIPGPVVNTTGCGDAFISASGYALLCGMTARKAARFGLAASSLCAQTSLAVDPAMTPARILAILKQQAN